MNDDLQKTYEQLEQYIFGLDDEVVVEQVIENSEVVNEVEMADAAAGGDAAKGMVNGGPDASTAADTPAEEKPNTVEDGESTK